MRGTFQRLTWLFSGLAVAFQDASPLIALSSSRSLNLTDGQRLVTLVSSGTKLQQRLESSLGGCSVSHHYLITIPGVSDMDLSSPDSLYAIRKVIAQTQESVGSSSIIGNVVGKLDLDKLQEHVLSSCTAQGKSGTKVWHDCTSKSEKELEAASYTQVFGTDGWRFCEQNRDSSIVWEPSNIIYRINLPALPEDSSRANVLAKYDRLLAQLIGKSHSFTAVVATTPPNPDYHWRQGNPGSFEGEGPYYMDETFSSDTNMELKRDFGMHNRDDVDSRPLFEKYNFLSPGLFMGLFITILLVTILYIALTALASMQVSYMSFSKEMGPAAQRKQQQG